jgi:hypothetical protein
MRLRSLQQERLAITKARQQAERTLDNADSGVARLGLVGRRRRRSQVLADVSASRATLRLADERLTTLSAEIRDLRTQHLEPQADDRASVRRGATSPALDLVSDRIDF